MPVRTLFAGALCAAACASGVEGHLRSASSELAPNILGELHNAENIVSQALKGKPDLVQKELQLFHKAEAAANDVKKFSARENEAKKRAELLQQQDTLSRTHTSGSDTEEAGRLFLSKSLEEQRSFGAAERNLANDGKQVLSEFSNVEDAIANAFAGKNSSAIKTAMKAGELLEQAREKQQQVTTLNADEASRAEKSAALLDNSMSAQNEAKQRQQAYITGMTQLAKDEKAEVAEFDTVKNAVAQAFAGKDSRAVEKAMSVGELLDKARADQQDVANRDAIGASEAPKLFKKFSSAAFTIAASAQHHSVPVAAALAQSRVDSELRVFVSEQAAMKAKRATHLRNMVANEEHIVDEISKAKDVFKRNFAPPKGSNKTEAAVMEQEVLAMLGNATKVEQRTLDATSQAAARATETK